ncbi:TetR family transcriptional regulator [Achromatium sp. WMS3]|nr:TetR family transcriptional regulator [Achromatium sp. WMS3]
MTSNSSPNLHRKQLILESLARELEVRPKKRITTAVLAKSAEVSEATLYRHFASKAQMFEALISFAEEAVFSRINQILSEEQLARERCKKILFLLLGFAEKNPGITRVLLGEVLLGEHERLQVRVDQFFSRFETQLRQVLREAPLREGRGENFLGAEGSAQLLLSVIEGRLHKFIRSSFNFSPVSGWETQWEHLSRALFRLESV